MILLDHFQVPKLPRRSVIGCQKNKTAGMTKMEVLAAAAILLTVMSVTATMFHKVNLMWKDIRHHRIATSELANRLDVLTRIAPKNIAAEIDELKPSAVCDDALPKATLSAKLVKDPIGQRIDLEIQWRSRVATRDNERPNRARLSGWLTERGTE